MNAIIGIRGHCAECEMTFELKPWQLNSIAINEPFECAYCQSRLKLGCDRQLRQFRTLNQWALVRPSMIILTCATLLVALVAEWVGLLSVIGQFNISLVTVLIHFLVLRYARYRQRMTLNLRATHPLPIEQLARVACTRLRQQ
jgi:DNA-directed RNA polymerase subunit RPC12/RpoP